MLTTAHLSPPEPDESSPQPHYTSWRIILILFSHQTREKCKMSFMTCTPRQTLLLGYVAGAGENINAQRVLMEKLAENSGRPQAQMGG